MDMSTFAANPRRFGALAAVILVVAVAVGAVVSTLRPVAELDPDSPEGVVQLFFQAVEGRDWDQAYSLLEPGLRNDCRKARLPNAQYEFDRVVIDEVIVSGSATVVVVDVRRVDVADPINPYVYDETMEFEIKLAGGSPVITRLPWQFYCGG